jgi:hypothetical protein
MVMLSISANQTQYHLLYVLSFKLSAEKNIWVLQKISIARVKTQQRVHCKLTQIKKIDLRKGNRLFVLLLQMQLYKIFYFDFRSQSLDFPDKIVSGLLCFWITQLIIKLKKIPVITHNTQNWKKSPKRYFELVPESYIVLRLWLRKLQSWDYDLRSQSLRV